MTIFKERTPGIILAIILGIAGKYLASWLPSLGGVTLAIILGILVRNLIVLDKKYDKGIRFVEKDILALSIMLMGLNLEMNILFEIGFSSILIIIVMVISTVLLGTLIGRVFGLSKSFSILLGVGNGICGSSAIAAVSPVVSDNQEEIGLSVSVINLLGTFGIFLVPAIANILNLNETSSGLMIGSTLQATGQVVAAGFSISDLVGKIATIVKMGRILMLGPVVIFLSLFFAKKNDSSNTRVSIPPFIIGFFIFSIISTLQVLPTGFVEVLKDISKLLLTIAMAGIGLKIRVSSLTSQGPKALLAGVTVFGIQITLVIGLLYLFF